MFKILSLVGAASCLWAASASTVAAMPGGSDFSACSSGLDAKDPHQKISLYSACLKHGGVADAAPVVFYLRALAYEQVGEVDNAFQDYNSAIQYKPDWPNAYMGRAGIESARGLCREAIGDMDKAMKMVPPQAPYLNQLAWTLATCADPAVRDGGRAIALAQQSLKIRADSATQDTLAAAYAEAGQFDMAQAAETKAIQTAGEQLPRIQAMQARMQLYSHGLPFHTTPAPTAATGH